MRKILISETLDEIRVAIIDNSRLKNFFIDNNSEQISIRGNIYKAKMHPNAKGIEASFVDIGVGQSAFLSNLNPLKEEMGDDGVDAHKIVKNDFIMVQGISDYDSRKAPKVSNFIALPSKFCVIISKPGFLGISKKINDEKERKRLKSLKKMVTKNSGIILRTSSQNETIKDIQEDISKTKKKWREILTKFKENKSYGILHQEDNIINSILREFLTDTTKEIEFNSRKTYNYFKKNLGKNKNTTKLRIVNKKDDMFQQNKIGKDIEKLFHKKVNLKNGSFLIIEEKEGLTVVDVNSGRSLKNTKESNLSVNIYAAKEIAHQVILRNLGGIVLIDFIDLNKRTEKNKLFNVFKKAMRTDKAKHTILPMSKFGIIEMTRQRKGARTSTLVSESCHVCYGSGLVTKKEIVCYELLRKVVTKHSSNKKKKIEINIHPNLIQTLNTIIEKNQYHEDVKNLNIQIVEDSSINNYKMI
ncbi:MAG: ribonuclease E/G [Thermodesulfobacteriota bacterium]|nr:ribonuclease E/G [Thermodesulfobacteriota bacterium]